MVYSASVATAEASRATGFNSAHYLARQSVYLAAAFLAASLVFLAPVRLWQSAAPWIFMLGIALLVLVLVPGVGREVNGARRWINLYLLNFQPSELMKF